MDITEHGDRFSLIRSGAQVTRLSIDWAVTLIIASETGDFEVRIELPFILRIGHGSDRLLTPDQDPGNLSPALRLVRQTATRVDAFKNGRLEIEMADESALTVASSDEFEPWTISDNDGNKIVSTPDGELAIWRSEPPTT